MYHEKGFCVLDSSKFFGALCIVLFTKKCPRKNAGAISAVKNMPIIELSNNFPSILIKSVIT